MSQSIKRSKLRELYDLPNVCSQYKSKIDKYLTEDLFAEDIEVSDDDINNAFASANSEQLKVLKKYFKKVGIAEDISDFSDILRINGIKKDSLGLVKHPTLEDRGVNGLKKVLQIAKAYNKGWVTDFDNTSQQKWYVYLYRSGGRWVVDVHSDYGGVHRPSGVYFKSRELALDSIEKFRNDYDDFYMI